MKMIRVGHLRTTVTLNDSRVAVEDYGDWLPLSQIAMFKSGYTHVDAISVTPDQPVTSLVWVATIEAVDGTIYEAPNPEVAKEWHRQVLGTEPGPIPPLPEGDPGAFVKKEMTIEKWPAGSEEKTWGLN